MIQRRLTRFGWGLTGVVVALMITVSTSHADFGVAPGSFFARTHEAVPVAPFIGVQGNEGQPPAFESTRADTAGWREAILGAPLVTQAGAHPDASVGFSFDERTDPALGGAGIPDGELRDSTTSLPAGFLGDPQAVPTCSRADFAITTAAGQGTACPPATQVGIAFVQYNFLSTSASGDRMYVTNAAVYNITPPPGAPAAFGFRLSIASNNLPTILVAHLRTGGDYGVTVETKDTPTFAPIYGATVTLWGVPASPVHDPQRLNPDSSAEPWGDSDGGVQIRPFLSNPSYCDSGPLDTAFAATSWQEPGRILPEDPADAAYNSASSQPTGCNRLAFGGPGAPVSLEAQAESRVADTPTGFDVNLDLPYNEDPGGLARPTLRETTVALPEGLVVNPSSANGLAACSSQQIGLLGTEFAQPFPIRFTPGPAECPDASKIGTVTVTTPLLDHPMPGSVYLARQYDNPFHSLLALYIGLDDPTSGIIAKLPGRIEADPRTGRLTAVFPQNPQLPFTNLRLQLNGGQRAPLLNPTTCGTETTSSTLTPWSAPYTPPVTSTSTSPVTVGAGGSPCATNESQLPDRPSFEAGTVTPLAGTYSPFVLKLSREDGSQRISSLDTTLPEGLLAGLAGTTECPDSALAAAASRSKPGEGALEQGSPSCPSASQLGSVDVAAGAGSEPVHVAGKAYLAGPYKGAPLSLAIVTPAIAGPFDLGTVVVRTALFVDETTAQIHAVSDPIPSILEGIPLDVRLIALNLDRPDFTLNPTSCEPMSVSGSATSTLGNVATLGNRFQVGGCNGLEFEPKLALRVFGKTARNAKPRFRAVLQAKAGEANIKRAQVNLPHSEFLEQNHIKTVCTRVQFNAGAGHGSECPKGSIYGQAKAWSPLLEKPLQGPVYLRSSSHKLPDLVAALNGQIDVALAGKVDSGPNKGIRNTFEVVPDAPVSKFILEMKGGKKGLLVNSENLCAKGSKTTALAHFVGQNGKIENLKPKVANSCGGGRKHVKGSKGK